VPLLRVVAEGRSSNSIGTDWEEDARISFGRDTRRTEGWEHVARCELDRRSFASLGAGTRVVDCGANPPGLPGHHDQEAITNAELNTSEDAINCVEVRDGYRTFTAIGALLSEALTGRVPVAHGQLLVSVPPQ
jgi:hypothetical protein